MGSHRDGTGQSCRADCPLALLIQTAGVAGAELECLPESSDDSQNVCAASMNSGI